MVSNPHQYKPLSILDDLSWISWAFNAFLEIILGRFDGNFMQFNKCFVIKCFILASFQRGIPKIGPLECFQLKAHTINHWLQCCGHCIQINAFIFDIGENFLPQVIVNEGLKLQCHSWPYCFSSFKQPNVTCLGC